MAEDAVDIAEPRVLPRTLAGATVLQIVPALRNTAQVRTTLGAARALVHVGARAIVAGETGEMVDELKSFGGEWLPFSTTHLNRSRLRANAQVLDKFVTAERVHIVHAKSTGAARSAAAAANRSRICLVADIPDLPGRRLWLAAFYLGDIGRADRLISHSLYSARPFITRHRIPPERVSVIPRSIDLAAFNPSKVSSGHVTALRRSWGIPSGMRVVLVPGPIAPANGQIHLVHAARILADDGTTGVTFVLAGDDRRHRRYVRKFWKRARAERVEPLFRMIGHYPNMPEAYAAADIVVIPYTKAPLYGHVVAEAQAMARPVIATSVGPLPENMLTQPRATDGSHTGWEVPPADTGALAQALAEALALDPAAYRAHSARARQFAEYMFSPQRAAAATLEVYASLLEADDSRA
jgi:glycosyltransferase involved in cell wall biosynthesis